MPGGPAIIVEHVTRLDDELAPDWPQGNGSYRVQISGFPNMRCELEFEDEHGDHAVGGVILTATRIVNAIPAVCDAKPGAERFCGLRPRRSGARPGIQRFANVVSSSSSSRFGSCTCREDAARFRGEHQAAGLGQYNVEVQGFGHDASGSAAKAVALTLDTLQRKFGKRGDRVVIRARVFVQLR